MQKDTQATRLVPGRVALAWLSSGKSAGNLGAIASALGADEISCVLNGWRSSTAWSFATWHDRPVKKPRMREKGTIEG